MELLRVESLKKYYEIRRLFHPTQYLRALDGVSFSLHSKEVLALVGESGCGKSTLAKQIMRLEDPSSGEIYLKGKSSSEINIKEWRRKIQMVFQDPFASLNPRKKIGKIIAEPLIINQKKSYSECLPLVLEMMQKVGLHLESINKYPHMFSGGQRQRIGLARALMLRPEIIIFDEPVSALDLSIQAQVINLLMDLQEEFSLSYLFITHDLSVVEHLADRVMVMYLGKIVEYGKRENVLHMASHPYTKALLDCTPSLDGKRGKVLSGELASPLYPPKGCSFHPRCSLQESICRRKIPALEEKQNKKLACHLVK